MKTRLIIFFLLTASGVFAQIGFEEHIVVAESFTTISPQLVNAADIDGDNDLDIVSYGTGLNWYENIDGLGNFDDRIVIAGLSSMGSSLYTVDFDYDGDIDVIGTTNNRLTLYRNVDGFGNFEAQLFTLGTGTLKAVPMDVDGDNDKDLAIYYYTGPAYQGKLVWLENDGAGNFAAEQIITTTTTTLNGMTLMHSDDLDGDGDQDIILGYGSNDKISWLRNTDGNGAFSTPIVITILADGLTSVKSADIDNDGDKDVVASSATDNQVAWYQNLDGQGTFGDLESIIVSNATGTNSVFVTTVNNDNTVDILYTANNEIYWTSNTNGLGSFGIAQIIADKAYSARSVIMADLDGDGIKDAISASQGDDKIAWYKHDGNGNFGRQVTISRRAEYPNNVYPGDYDGDGDVDLLVNSQHDAKLAWLENVNGLGFYGKQHVITENTAVGNFTPVAYPGDFDDDGDLDIAVRKNTVLFWYENVDGLGNFTIEHIIDSSSSATQIKTMDVDGDGKVDIICGVYTSNGVSWYKNLGSNGTFGTEQYIVGAGTNGSLTSLEIADIDGDSDEDIIASSYNTDTWYFKNTDGLGTFVQQNVLVFNRMWGVYPADMDGDGDLDVVGVSGQGGGAFDAVLWYENGGQGNFTAEHDISTLTVYGRSITVADLDNDGDMDVLTAGGHQDVSGQLAWYPNNGNGTFAARQMIEEVFDYTIGMCVARADVDNDNDMDVIGVFGLNSSSNLGKVSVFKNFGALGNTITGSVIIDTDSNGCNIADLKGSNLMVISNNGTHSFATFTDIQGQYHVATETGTFNTAITSALPTHFTSTPASHTFTFTGMNNTQTANFCVVPVGVINDVEVAVYPSLNNLRPGFNTHYRIVYKNTGTTVANGIIVMTYDNNKMILLNASQAIASQTDNTLTFNFSNLELFETRTIDINFTVFTPPTTNINDEVATSVAIVPVSGTDLTPDNNSFGLEQTVVGSYDPNDVTCLEGAQVFIDDADEFLHYVIRFQNTGTANAINVRVESVLDSKLDWTTMQLESLSHSCRVEINDGSTVKFIFENINLSAVATNEPDSHGFIAYKIKPKNSVVVGDIVNASAGIYFDFNPPIVTNTAATQFVDQLGVAETEANRFRLYPNPTTGVVNISGNTLIDQLSLFDMNGRVLKQFDLSTPTLITQIDLTDLKTGFYILKIKSSLGYTNTKIIKK